jgi:toxin CcdB
VADVLILQLDIFPNPAARLGSDAFVIVLQSDFVSETRGVLAAPLSRIGDPPRDPKLYPIVRIGGGTFAVVVTEMAAVPRKLLTEPVANLSAKRDRIVRALDFLFTGI